MAINMQSYLSALLLILLLLVDNSNSISLTSLIKFTGKLEEWFKAGERLVDKCSENPQPNAPLGGLFHKCLPEEERSINVPLPNALFKAYLSQFGYLQDSGPFDDSLDKSTISAIKAYQQFFKLQITGNLTDETIQQMSLPRCGVPDLNFDYDLTTSNVSWPKGKPQWFPRGTKNLTYGFHPASEVPLNMTKAFRDAFTLWSSTTKVLILTETTYDDADIKIGFYNLNGIGAMVGFTFIRLQPDSGVKTAEMRLDGSKYWVLPTDNNFTFEQNQFDLESVAMHQIGHLLGLEHSSNNESVMYPAILPTQQRKVLITDSDNETIHQLYTADTNSRSRSATSGSFALFGSSSGLITTFSLGFLYMALSL